MESRLLILLFFSPSTNTSALKSSGTLGAERCPFGLYLSITYDALVGTL